MNNSSTIKVLGIVGSPRKGGNTDILVDKILEGTKQTGAITEKVMLNNLDIGFCQACDSCRKTGKCKQKDDMAELEKKMNESHIWILGTPIYWWGPTAQMKTFIDRWYCARQVNFQGRRIILALPLGGGERTARHTIGMLTDTFNYQNMELFNTILAPSTYEQGEIKNQKKLLEKAKKIGEEAVNTLT